MNALLLSLLLAQASPDPAAEATTVYSCLSESAHEELVRALAARAPGTEWRFEAVSPEGLLAGLREPPGAAPAAILGYAVPLLLEAAEAGFLAAAPQPLTSAAEMLRDRDDRYQTLWFDPVVIAYAAVDRVEPGLAGARPEWLAPSFEALCSGRFQERLRLASAQSWNATGVLVTSLSEEAGGGRAADRLLQGLDGNLSGPYFRTGRVLLGGLESAPPGTMAVASLADVRHLQAEGNTWLRVHLPGGPLVCRLLGVGAVAGAPAKVGPLYQVLDVPAFTTRLAALEEIVPAVESVPDGELAGWMVPYRHMFAGEVPRLQREQPLARVAVKHFNDKVLGSLARKEAMFNEYYDAIGIVLMVVFIVWILRRKGGSADAGSGRASP